MTDAGRTAVNDASVFGHDHVTVIEPPSGWSRIDWQELWAYRELLWVFVLRDVKVRYRQTVLGAAWAILRPVLSMVIFTVIFGRLAGMPSDGYPYAVFVYAGLLPWTFFANAVGSSGGSVLASAHLVTKVYFPRLIIPLAASAGGLVDLAFSTLVLLVMMMWYGVGWSWHLLAVPALVVALTFAALGVGMLLAALLVAYRDFNHLSPFLIQVWMYLTPVIFPVSLVPPAWRWLLYANPMAGLVEGFRAAFLGKPFDLAGLLLSCAAAVACFIAALAYFHKVERRFADII